MVFKIFFFSFVFSLGLNYGIQKLFFFLKKFDNINHRSSHKTLATRTGGIGVFLTSLLISFFFYFKNIEIFDYSLFISFGIMFIVGVYDDFYNADFKLKFFLQIIVAKILIDQGLIISNYYGLFGIYEVPHIFGQLTTIFVFLVVVNAINFIDGIDGLAITQVIKSILLYELFSKSFSKISLLSVIIIASLLPLYYFNFKKKRKIFLGDGGSMFLGTVVMVYVLNILNSDYQLIENLSLNKTLFSVLLVLYPLIDLLRVFILRVKDGKSPFVADSNHLHHKLLVYYKGSHIKSLILIIVLELTTITLLTKFFVN